jgi:hypothetical protein
MTQVAIGRKNWLFLGGAARGERMADLLMVVSSAVRNDLDVWTYIKDELDWLLAGRTDYEALRPDRWAASHPEHIRVYRTHERRDRADRQHHCRAARRAARCPPRELLALPLPPPARPAPMPHGAGARSRWCALTNDRQSGDPAVPLRAIKNMRPDGAETSQPRATPWDTDGCNGAEALKGRDNGLHRAHSVRGNRSPAGLQNPRHVRLRGAAHIGANTRYAMFRAVVQMHRILRKALQHGWLATCFALSGLMTFGWCLCTQGVALG